MIELRHTDLPWPVAPATSMCGSLARSTTRSVPAASLPSSSGTWNFPGLFFCQSSPSMISRKWTEAGLRFGTSMPTAFLPGIGASMRREVAWSAIWRLRARPATFSTRVPRSSVRAYCVTTGPAT